MTRIAIPIGPDRRLAHFGVAPAYAIYEVEDGRGIRQQQRANPDPEHAAANDHKLVLDQVRDCQVIIAEQMGPPLVRSLEHLGIRVLRAPSPDGQQSLAAYLHDSERLEPFTLEQAAPPPGHQPHAGHDHPDH